VRAPRQASKTLHSVNRRLLIVATPLLVARFPELLRRLLDRGNELVFTIPADRLPEGLRDHPRASTVALPPERTGNDAEAVRAFRAAADLVRFLGPRLEVARWPKQRAFRRLTGLLGVRWTRETAEAGRALRLPAEVCAQLAAAFRELERVLPPQDGLERAISAVNADAMLVVTRCALGGVEPDALKVARRLGMPSIMLVCSWDNLSAKATLNEHPDHLLVWNETQADEACELHGVDRRRIRVVGAPSFDRFFDEIGAGRRDVRPPEQTPRIVYLGSSAKVAPHEARIFDDWIAAVRSSGDRLLEQAHVVVRPHPSAARRWHKWRPPDERVSISSPTERREVAAVSELLLSVDAAVALNTSAEIEAAIAGVPVLTFRAGRRARGQEGSLHFAYLLERNGGFVLDAHNLDEHVGLLAAVLRHGHDSAPARRFVTRFVRPAGLSHPVGPRVADTILELASREQPRRLVAL
jgi:hypothetical protein